MPNVKVIRSHRYAGRNRPEGSSYQADQRDVEILTRMGYVEMDGKAVVKKPLEEFGKPPREHKPAKKAKSRRADSAGPVKNHR